MKIMKNGASVLALTTVLVLGLAGCGKNEPATPTADDANKAAAATADAAAKNAETAKAEAVRADEVARAEAARVESAKVEAARAEEAAKAEALKAETARVEAANAADAAKAVEAAKVADTNKFQELIDKAKVLVAEGKLSDASSVLQQLTGHTLSADQTKLVDGLKEQIQKALAAKAAENAAGTVSNLLNK